MTTYIHPRSASVPQAAQQATWCVFGSAVAFGIPYLGVSVLNLQHDVYYGAYLAITLALLAVYARYEHVDPIAVHPKLDLEPRRRSARRRLCRVERV